MNILTKIPLIGDVLGKLFDRLWPDKTKYAERVLEIELEEARQSGGKMTPRKLLKYVVVCWIVLAVLCAGIQVAHPGLNVPDLMLEKAVWLAGVLFGFGG